MCHNVHMDPWDDGLSVCLSLCLYLHLFIPFVAHKFSFGWQLIASKTVDVFDFLVNSC